MIYTHHEWKSADYPLKRSISIEEELNVFSEPYLITIEGNIGSGKTTVMKHAHSTLAYYDGYLSTTRSMIFFEEPVNKWRSVFDSDGRTVNLLEQFYVNPSEYFVPLQNRIRKTFIDQQRLPIPSYIRVTERHVHSATPFIDVAKQMAIVHPQSVKALRLQHAVETAHVPLPYATIYLKVSPERAQDQIRRRTLMEGIRSEEQAITLEYLRRVDDAHDKWLHHPCYGSHVVKINANEPVQEVKNAVTRALVSLSTMIEKEIKSTSIREANLKNSTYT
ncbi:MAG TPA: deoxynucleoside kinase [Candidatus Nanoarchaeia archaeon]|nr:deoxynucleoside kinase [Candidatus Nanoarchaeia archaeon]